MTTRAQRQNRVKLICRAAVSRVGVGWGSQVKERGEGVPEILYIGYTQIFVEVPPKDPRVKVSGR